MPVAQGEVGQAGALRPVKGDQVVRGAGIRPEVGQRAVRQADADRPVGRGHPVHGLRQIVHGIAAGEHGRQHEAGAVAEICWLGGEMKPDVVRQSHPSQPFPRARRRVGVVIAGDQVPAHARELPHTLDRLAQGSVSRGGHVIDVAGDQDGAGAVLLRQLAQAHDCLQPFVAQDFARGVVDEAVGLANLPVGSVD